MNRKGFSLLEVLISAVVLCLVSYFIVKNYYGAGGTSSIDPKTRAELSKEGVKTDSLPAMTDSAQSKVDEYNKKIKEQQKDLQAKQAGE